MPASEPLAGVFAPNLTPFRRDGSVDTARYIAHAKDLLANGCAGLVPFGTTGEALSVGIDERSEILRALVDASVDPGRLIPGTGIGNLPDTLRLTREAAGLGCRGVLVLPPHFFKNVHEDGLYRFYAALTQEMAGSGCGIYLYHIPQVSGVGVPVSLARRLREAFPDEIAGIKDSSGDWDNTAALLDIPGLAVYPGNENRLLDALERGAPGVITATANVASGPIGAMIRAYRNGGRGAAEGLMEQVRANRMALDGCAAIPAMKRMRANQTGDEAWAGVRPPLLEAPEPVGRTLEDRLSLDVREAGQKNAESQAA